MRSKVAWYALGGGTLIAAAAVGAFAIEHNIGLPIARLEPPASVVLAPAPAPATPAKPNPAKPDAEPAPAFDVVRVEPTGETVVAGHAAPRAKVELRDDERALASVTADDNGQFVILPEPLAAGSHRLRLAANDDKGVARLSDVVPVDVAPPKTSPPPQVASAKPPEAKPPAAPPAGNATALAAPPPAAAPLSAQSPAPPVAVAALQPTNEAKSAAPGAPLSANSLSVSSVKASDQGRLEAEGTAEPGARLRLSLNGAFLAEVVASLNGLWSLTIEHGMTPGLYTLEAQQVGAAGGARAQVSFAYSQSSAALVGAAEPTKPEEKPQSVALALAPPPGANVGSSHATVTEVLTTTVVRGDNLWDLARRYYGDGLRYADIFSANSAQIRNPNLIYVGQVFVVPHNRAAHN